MTGDGFSDDHSPSTADRDCAVTVTLDVPAWPSLVAVITARPGGHAGDAPRARDRGHLGIAARPGHGASAQRLAGPRPSAWR